MTGRTWLVWSWPARPVPVVTCPLCAALVQADGLAQHERHHAATTDQEGGQ